MHRILPLIAAVIVLLLSQQVTADYHNLRLNTSESLSLELKSILVDSFTSVNIPQDLDVPAGNEYSWIADFSKFRTPNFDPTASEYLPTPYFFFRNFRIGDVFDTSTVPTEVEYFTPDLNESGVFGIRARFDHYLKEQWITVRPTFTRITEEMLDDERRIQQYHTDSIPRSNRTPHYIQFHGLTTNITLWLWSSGQSMDVYFYVEDFNGVVHELSGDTDAVYGWHRIVLDVPDYIPQTVPHYPFIHPIKFLSIKLIPHMTNWNEDFIVYLANLSCDRYEIRLADAPDGGDRTRSIWSEEQPATPNGSAPGTAPIDN